MSTWVYKARSAIKIEIASTYTPLISTNTVLCRWKSSVAQAPAQINGDLSTSKVGSLSNGYQVNHLRYSLPPLSCEQQKAREVLSTPDGNVIINACAGSGKTTTLLRQYISLYDLVNAEHDPELAKFIKKSFLVLLYNRHLRLETIERARSLGLENVTIDNYHGLGYHFYSTECSTDQGLKRVVKDDLPPLSMLPDFDVLVMDEQQDMNPIIFSFVQKVLRDAISQGQKKPQILSLGDPRQEIYQFNNADKRFLTLCKELFPESGDINGKTTTLRAWTELEQRTSFRFTQPIADFVNKQLLRLPEKKHILAIKHEGANPKPRYIVCDAYSDVVLNELVRLISIGIPASDILVLGPSLRAVKNPIRSLANKLVLQHPNIRIHIPTDDDEDITSLVRLDKVIFASYHQAKGIEREAAIIFSFDNAYLKFFDRNAKDLETVSNTQYVAATRAKRHLVLIHHYQNDYLPFVVPHMLPETCEVVEHEQVEVAVVKESSKIRWTVTDLTRNIPETVISRCFALLELKLKREARKFRVFPPTQIQVEEDVWEGVAEITGTAVPAIFEWQSRHTCKMAEEVFKSLHAQRMPDTLDLLPHKYIDHLLTLEIRAKERGLDIQDILFLACVSNATQSGYINKVISIPRDKYTWYTAEHAASAFEILSSEISDHAFYERMIGAKFEDIKVGDKGVSLRGCVDIMDYYYNTIWELKWTNTLRPEHVLQTALYAAIDHAYRHNKDKETGMIRERQLSDGKREPKEVEKKKIRQRRKRRLLHVPTGQMVDVAIKNGRAGYLELLRILVNAKVEPNELATGDDKFLRQAAKGFEDVISPMTVPTWLNMSSIRKPY